ncbi:serine kinase [candidate division KSB1 bacterium]|nr:serine kinase [candidate division KSB1 bacterium]
MVLETIAKKLSLKPLYENMKIDIEINGIIASDILSDVMARAQKGDLWITNQTHVNVIAIIFFKGLCGAILPGGRELDNDAAEKAIEKGIPVFMSDLSAFDLAGQIYGMGIRE